MNGFNFGAGGGSLGTGASGFQVGGGFQQKQQPSLVSFGSAAPASSGYNTPQQTNAFQLGGQSTVGGLSAFGQNIGGFASPQTGFGGTKMGTGLSGGLGGLGAKTSPSAFSVGGSLGGAFAGSVAQQPGPFGGTSGFGAQPQQQQVGGGMFGGMAGNNLGFGQQQAAVGLGGGFNQQLQQGTGNPPFNPTKIEETVMDRNRVQKRETSHLQVITGQSAYEGKSQEELRLEDYRKNLRGPANTGGAFQMGGSTLASPFGAAATSTFGQPATGFRPGGGFGQATAAPAFGAGGGMFGATTPSVGSMFSQQPAQPAFGIQQPSTGFTFGQPAAQPAASNMFSSAAPMQSFGTGSTFGATQQFGAAAPIGTNFLGSTPAFGTAPAFAQPAATGGFGGLGGGLGGAGGFGLTTPANPGFGAAVPTAQPFGSFGAPAAATGFNSFSFSQPPAQSAAGNIFAAPAATSGFGLPASGGLSSTPASTGVFGSLGGGLGLAAPAATSFSFGAPAAPAASPFGAFQAPGAATLNMFPGSTGFGQPAPAATSLGFGGFGGFGTAAPLAKPATSGFSAVSSTTPAFGGFGSSFGANIGQQSMLSAPVGVQQPLMQQPQCPPMDLRMDLLRTKRDELDVELKDARIYGSSGQQTGSLYSSTTFTIPQGMRPYKQTSRSAAKIVPRGLISSATMTTLERPLSSVLSAASSGGSSVDLMSPEKLLGRSAKRLIITSNGLGGADPTIDLPLPSYQQQQKQSTQLAVTAQQEISPPRALMRDATSGQTRAFEITNGGDVTGLTPSATRSPYTPTSSRSSLAPNTGTSDMDYAEEAPLRATSLRMGTPGPRQSNERERESLDRGTDDDDASSDIPNPPTLSKRGYITTPSMSALGRMSASELSRVKNFSIYRPMHGKIEWEGETDVRGLDLDLIVTIEKKNVSVYDGEEAEAVKPSVGMGLNKSAIIYLKDIFPSGSGGTSSHSELQMDLFLEKLKRKCESDGTEFLDYDTATGEWIFRVDHFSRYGLDDSDDDVVVPAVIPVTALAEKMPPIVLLPIISTPATLPALGYLTTTTPLDHTENDNAVHIQRPVSSIPYCTPRVAVSTVAREAMVAAEEARSHPFHLTEDSPCMRLLLQVKNKYIGLTGQSPAMRTILTKVSGNGAPINAVRQRHPVDMSLSMGRSFRVGWGPNGEIVHSGSLLFGSEDASFGQYQRVVVEKVNSLRWTEERAKSDFPAMSDVSETPHLMHSCEDSLKAILRHSFVFDSASNADIDAPECDARRGSKEVVVPLWRAPHAKPWELKEYLPYLNLLEDLQGAFDKRGLSKVHSDWAVGKAVELVSAVSGQEDGSYTEAKALYSAIGNANKLDKERGWKEREDSLIERLEGVRESIDFMPLYEDRDSHLPIDWERRREAISAWLVNITTVEVDDDIGEVDRGSGGQNEETYSRIFELLSCRRLFDAVELAESAGLFRLATLLSQIGDDIDFVKLISMQLEQWSDNEGYSETNTIPKGILDLYRLMGAEPFPSDSWPGESILRNVGWMQALAMIFWYCDSLSSPDESMGKLSDSLVLYDKALLRGYVAEPLSPYVEDADPRGMNMQYPDTVHGLYSLLQVFFRNPETEDIAVEAMVINAIRPGGYTRDALDYRSVYTIMQLLECMGIASSSSTYSSICRNNFMSQLISQGCWLWAVFIALQIPDDIQRSFVVKEFIMRYGMFEDDVALFERTRSSDDIQCNSSSHDVMDLRPLRQNTTAADQIHFLVNILHVPVAWLHEAAACSSGYKHSHIKQVMHLNFAQLWRPAKEIVFSKLAPTIWTESNSVSEKLLNLLESMDSDEDRNSKSNVLLNFLRLKVRVAGVQSASRGYAQGEHFDVRMFGEDLQDMIEQAESLLNDVRLLNSTNAVAGSSNSRSEKGPNVERAALLNMGTYLFDLIDRLKSDYFKVFCTDSNLYDGLNHYEHSLEMDYPVFGDTILQSLQRQSSTILKRSALKLPESYRMSRSGVAMNVE